MFIFILYVFRAAMCPSSGEFLYQCDTWFMSLCVDDRLVCSYTCIPDGLKGKITIFYLEIVDLKQESGTKSFER